MRWLPRWLTDLARRADELNPNPGRDEHEKHTREARMAEMSRGDMMRRLDGASKDLLKRVVNGPLTDGKPNGLARTIAGLVPVGADEPPAKDDTGPTTSIVDHLAADDDVAEPREDV
jgi:hypothetical protein